MPPQPAGIWNSVYNDSKWTDATGPDRYRRAIYTFIKRTAAIPARSCSTLPIAIRVFPGASRPTLRCRRW